MPFSRTLTFGISRNHAGAQLGAWAEAVATALGAALGTPVRVAVADDYDALLGQITTGQIDVAWLPPLLHARAAEQGARLVALPQREGWLTFRSALLVRRDDPIASPGELRGARVAWRDRHSASGYLFPRIALAARGAPPEQAFSSEKFFGTVQEAAQAVVAGEADLCTCYVSDPAANDSARAMVAVTKVLGPLAERLRVLLVTDPIPPDGLVVAPQIGDEERAAVTRALLSLHTSVEGRNVLAIMLQAERLAPVNDTLLRSLRSWAEAAERRVG